MGLRPLKIFLRWSTLDVSESDVYRRRLMSIPALYDILKIIEEPHTISPGKHEALAHVGLMLGQRRRRWADVSPTLGQRLVFAGHVLYRVNKYGLLNMLKNVTST